jgi:hypothetical protein
VPSCAKEIYSKKNEKRRENVVPETEEKVYSVINYSAQVSAVPECGDKENDRDQDEENTDDRVACFIAQPFPESHLLITFIFGSILA